MTSPILLNLLIRPAPMEFPETDRTRELVQLWDTHVGGGSRDELGDFEDFFEQAARLEAVIATYPLHLIYLTIQGERTARNLETGQTVHVDELGDITRFGLQASYDLAMNPHLRNEAAADNYMSWDAFKKFAGRTIDYCGSYVDDPDVMDFTDRLFTRYQAGERRFFIKSVAVKKGLWDITLPDTINTIKDLESFLIQDEHMMGWALASASGSRHAFVIQDYTPMSYEYRFFVVNHQLVTGAGCVEEFTPLDNTQLFDPKMRENRKQVSTVTMEPELLTAYYEFAQQVVDAVREENPQVSNYVLDVAVDVHGNPLVVEFNSLLNSGLFASSMFSVVESIWHSN
jgi:hypothetical protein